jgi:hypothetical protein
MEADTSASIRAVHVLSMPRHDKEYAQHPWQSDQGPSPDLAVSLAEYEQVRREIHQRGNNQVTIQGVDVTLLAAILSFSGHFKGSHASLILALVFPFAFLGWYYFEQDLLIAQAASYIERKLKPRISEHVSELMGVTREPLLGWETFRHKLNFGEEADRLWIALGIAFRYVAVVGPGIAMWCWGLWRFGHAVGQYSVLEIILSGVLLGTGFAILLILVALVRAVRARYRSIVETLPVTTP